MQPKTYILQHKQDDGLFIQNLPTGSTVDRIRTTRDINKSEKFFQRGASLRIYKHLSSSEQSELKEELNNYKLVEVEMQTVRKGNEIEQIQFIFGG